MKDSDSDMLDGSDLEEEEKDVANSDVEATPGTLTNIVASQ